MILIHEMMVVIFFYYTFNSHIITIYFGHRSRPFDYFNYIHNVRKWIGHHYNRYDEYRVLRCIYIYIYINDMRMVYYVVLNWTNISEGRISTMMWCRVSPLSIRNRRTTTAIIWLWVIAIVWILPPNSETFMTEPAHSGQSFKIISSIKSLQKYERTAGAVPISCERSSTFPTKFVTLNLTNHL